MRLHSLFGSFQLMIASHLLYIAHCIFLTEPVGVLVMLVISCSCVSSFLMWRLIISDRISSSKLSNSGLPTVFFSTCFSCSPVMSLETALSRLTEILKHYYTSHQKIMHHNIKDPPSIQLKNGNRGLLYKHRKHTQNT